MTFWYILGFMAFFIIGGFLAWLITKRNLEKEIIRYKQQIESFMRLQNERDASEQARVREAEKRLGELQEEIDEKRGVLSNYQIEIVGKVAELDEWKGKQKALMEKWEKLNNETIEKAKNLSSLEEDRAKYLENKRLHEEEHKKLRLELEDLIERINDVKTRYRAGLAIEEGEGSLWELSELWGEEAELVDILREVKEKYPCISIELATIEWRKVWLPKIQELCLREGLGGKKGIYRLVLKGDESVCYVGQAVDIQKRWYEHIKKMVGSEPKGLERLYRYRPEEFYWSVVEFDPASLKEAEDYWIEFFGSKEKGLNRK